MGHKARLNSQLSLRVFCHLEGDHSGIHLILLSHQTERCLNCAIHPETLLTSLWIETGSWGGGGACPQPPMAQTPILGWYRLFSGSARPLPWLYTESSVWTKHLMFCHLSQMRCMPSCFLAARPGFHPVYGSTTRKHRVQLAVIKECPEH